MMIDLREAQVFVRQPAQPLHSRLHRELPAPHLSQKFSYVPLVHIFFSLGRIHSTRTRGTRILAFLPNPPREASPSDFSIRREGTTRFARARGRTSLGHAFQSACILLMLELPPVRRPTPPSEGAFSPFTHLGGKLCGCFGKS